MSARYFLDTNIIVYSFDQANKSKMKKARDLIARALEQGKGVVSYQVVQEFVNVATRKFAQPLKLQDCETYLQKVLLPLCEIFPGPDFFLRALETKERTQFSYYDSLIVQSALDCDCSTLYSEDLHDGYKLHSLTIINPFE